MPTINGIPIPIESESSSGSFIGGLIIGGVGGYLLHNLIKKELKSFNFNFYKNN